MAVIEAREDQLGHLGLQEVVGLEEWISRVRRWRMMARVNGRVVWGIRRSLLGRGVAHAGPDVDQAWLGSCFDMKLG